MKPAQSHAGEQRGRVFDLTYCAKLCLISFLNLHMNACYAENGERNISARNILSQLRLFLFVHCSVSWMIFQRQSHQPRKIYSSPPLFLEYHPCREVMPSIIIPWGILSQWKHNHDRETFTTFNKRINTWECFHSCNVSCFKM